jgi:hypothetical protein
VGVLAAVPDWREMLGGDDHPTGQAQAGTISAEPTPSTGPSASAGLSAKPAVSTIDLVVRDPKPEGDPTDLRTSR